MNIDNPFPSHSVRLAGFTVGRPRRLLVSPVLFLFASVLIGGCTSTSPLKDPDAALGSLPPDRSLRFTFSDGSNVEVAPWNYVVVREPDDFVSGEGTRVSRATGKTTPFSGKFIPRSFDQTGRYNTFSLSDSEYVRFRPGEYVVVRKTAGTGFFFASRDLGLSPDSTYTWRRPAGDIRLIEESSISVWKTAVLGAGIVVIVGAMVVGTAFSDFHLGGLRPGD